MEYAALFEPAEEGGFVITIPDFGWGFSQGETEVEARASRRRRKDPVSVFMMGTPLECLLSAPVRYPEAPRLT